MFQLPQIHGAAGGLANVKGWAKNGGVWAKIEKVGKECMFVGKGVISLGKENLMIAGLPLSFLIDTGEHPMPRSRPIKRWSQGELDECRKQVAFPACWTRA